MKQLQQKINYQFKDTKLLQNALTHSSYANETHKPEMSNERLEFLGDAVLSIIVSDYLFDHFRHIPEGELTRLRAASVCERSLCEFAKKLGLGQHLFLSRGEQNTGGRERSSILADAFEALIAAIYLDGGIEKAREFVLSYVKESIEGQQKVAFKDYKTALQEVIQQNPEDRLCYVPAGESGPDHNKTFRVEVTINSNVVGVGEGKSKKDAEQSAAKEALHLMGII
ncbi:MAG: ribonuclease III [Clostridia bacterium]|nr:ribonuclease III [Clostridia bacterium]